MLSSQMKLDYDNKAESSKENEENKGEVTKKINEEVSELKNIVGRQEEILKKLTHSFKESKNKNTKLKDLLDETHNWKNSFAERNERLAMRFQKCIPEKKEGSQNSSSTKGSKIKTDDKLLEETDSFRKNPRKSIGNRIKFKRSPKTPAESLLSKSCVLFHI
ncbi:unnamed protein product [Blepharisma stoltei]|uniref:Uncharacterized protein n=1 Tax=Blepharisma stoltei TaxID=1481888 RepID=A0AAU9K2P2_9CILI|nr:unnamed protein product [Blepharisma stoltei]